MSALISRPEAIRLMGRTFLFNYVKGSVLSPDDTFGHIDVYGQVICISDDLTPVEEADTVLHELIHAVDLTMGLSMTEHQVHHLATGLIALFQDNPELGSYLCEDKFQKLVKKVTKNGSKQQGTRGSTRNPSNDTGSRDPKGKSRQGWQQGTKRCNPKCS